ncbi:hypothetical protein CE195_07795 [Sodalis-like symbiont of Philaenus spumarius]|nr:hypothetical protein CE195_07795 [Sodalis-like symbiont of Philaenus spumarius]
MSHSIWEYLKFLSYRHFDFIKIDFEWINQILLCGLSFESLFNSESKKNNNSTTKWGKIEKHDFIVFWPPFLIS